MRFIYILVTKKWRMSFPKSLKSLYRPIFAFVITLFLISQSAYAQAYKNSIDTGKVVVNDSLLSDVVLKIASYSATIDHTDFLIRRKFNLSPIAQDLPEIERRVKGFKLRLEKKGHQMNLRSLNSGVIMLGEISGKLDSYQKVLTTYSSELSQSNREVKRILEDSVLLLSVSDSILQEQISDIQNEGSQLNVLQQKTLTQVNLLLNRVSITLLQATDVISDMRYLSISLKMEIWRPDQAPLLQAKSDQYSNNIMDAS